MSADLAPDQLRQFVERIMRLKDEQDAIAADVRDVYAEAKALGFDKTALGDLVTRLRKQAKNPEALSEREALLELYLAAYHNASRAHAHAPAKDEAAA